MAEEVAPLEIKDRVSLELWLRRQPREVAVITAARAALRVLPICWRFAAVAGGPQQFAKWTLSLFRANAVARIAGKYPTRAKGLRAAAATANVAAANAAANAANYAAYAVNVAAANAAKAAAANAAAAYAANAANAASAYAAATANAADADAANAAADDLWAAITADVAFLREAGASSCP